MKKKMVGMLLVMALAMTGCGHKNETVTAQEPSATEAPAATEIPAATGTPEATEGPKVTEIPAATGTPKVTEAPKATEASKTTEAPKATEASKATEEPKATEAPEAVTPAPVVTEAPKTTEAPTVTEAPETATPASVVTEAPKATEAPAVTEAPEEETPAPEVTVEPEPTEAPEEATPAPVVTEAPQPTETPVPTVECKHKNGHHDEVISESTCAEYGEVRYACNDCGYLFGGGYYLPRLEHNFSDGVCTNCGTAYCDHEFEDVVWREPDCKTGQGSAYEKCTKCGYVGDWKSIPYEHDFEEVMGFEGDCVTTPSYTLTCRNCGWEEKRDGDSVNPNNHRDIQEGTYTEIDLDTLETVTYYVKWCADCDTVFEHYEISRVYDVETGN